MAMCAWLLALGAGSPPNVLGADKYPTVDQLPASDELPDPFRFFGSDRRVKTKADWEQRQAEMLELLQHYIYGPAFPPVNRYKVESRTEEPLVDGKVIKYTANLKLGPDLIYPVAVEYYLLKNRASNSIVICVVAEDEPQDGDALEITKRDYAYMALGVGPFEKIAKSIHPDIQGTRTMGWVWGVNEVIHYVTREHQIDKVILTGCSRYGRAAVLASALNQRVDLTAPITTLAHAVHNLDETMWGPGNVKWGNQEYDTFAGKMNRLPVDRHFLGAVIAPRAYLGIMGAEKPAFNQGHIEAYEALLPVYEWLGAKQNLGLYDHAPREHGMNVDDLLTVLDFSDQAFYGKQPASGKQFDQTRNAAVVGFKWKAPPPPDSPDGSR